MNKGLRLPLLFFCHGCSPFNVRKKDLMNKGLRRKIGSGGDEMSVGL